MSTANRYYVSDEPTKMMLRTPTRIRNNFVLSWCSSYWRVTKAGAADRLRAMPTLSADENHNGAISCRDVCLYLALFQVIYLFLSGGEDVELIQQLQHSPRRRRCSATRVAKLVHTAPTPLAGGVTPGVVSSFNGSVHSSTHTCVLPFEPNTLIIF